MTRTFSGTLDTNVLLRLILGDDQPRHQTARQLVQSPNNWHVSMLTIAEIVYVLESKKYSRKEIRQNIEVICSLTNINLARGIIRPAIELYSSHPALSFVDACLVYEAEAVQAVPLWTFDKKLAAQSPAAKLLK